MFSSRFIRSDAPGSGIRRRIGRMQTIKAEFRQKCSHTGESNSYIGQIFANTMNHEAR